MARNVEEDPQRGRWRCVRVDQTWGRALMDALDLWRAELREGYRGQREDDARTWRFDALWRSACAVAFARDAVRQGLPAVALSWNRVADDVIRHAARARAARPQRLTIVRPNG